MPPLLLLLLAGLSTPTFACQPPGGRWFLRPDREHVSVGPAQPVGEVAIASVHQVIHTQTQAVRHPMFDFVVVNQFGGKNRFRLVARQTEVENNAYDLGLSFERMKSIQTLKLDQFLVEVEEHASQKETSRSHADGAFVTQKYLVVANSQWKPETTPVNAEPSAGPRR